MDVTWPHQVEHIMYYIDVYSTIGVDCTIRVWDLSLAVLVCEFKRHQDRVYSLVFSRDGTLLASGEC